MLDGFALFRILLIPWLSNWKTHAESPSQSIWNVFLSRSSILLISKSGSFILTRSTACFMSVRVFSPRKSIFTSPQSSICFIVYCVAIAPVALSAQKRGTYFSRFSRPITTPAAWRLVCLWSPSSFIAVSKSSDCFTGLSS